MSNKFRYFISTINYECRRDRYFEKSYEAVPTEMYDDFLKMKQKIIHLDGIFGKYGWIEVDLNDGSNEWIIEEITEDEFKELQQSEGYLENYQRIINCV